MKFTESIFNFLPYGISAEKAVNLAQAAFDKWLSEQKRLYGDGKYWGEEMDDEGRDSYAGYIVCIEEFAPKVCRRVCRHERIYQGNDYFMCKDCGKTLKPNWEVI